MSVEDNKFKGKTINEILVAMNEYQKQHNIEKECVANSSLLCVILTTMGFECEIVALFGLCPKKQATIVHFVVRATIPTEEGELRKDIIDPSYEWNHQTDDVAWFDSLVHLPKFPDAEFRRGIIATFIQFKKGADKMNERLKTGGLFAIQHAEYTRGLLNYVRSKIPAANKLFK